MEPISVFRRSQEGPSSCIIAGRGQRGRLRVIQAAPRIKGRQPTCIAIFPYASLGPPLQHLAYREPIYSI